MVCDVLDLHVKAGSMILHPTLIQSHTKGCAHQVETAVAGVLQCEIADNATPLVQHQGKCHPAGFVGHFGGADAVKKNCSVGPGDTELTVG